jgi:hypothetical protein
MTKTNTNASPIRFFWNGLKVAGHAKLIPCYVWFYDGADPHVALSARDYDRLPAVVREAFKVENHSDSNADYYDHDRFEVHQGSPYFAAALAAAAVAIEKAIARVSRRLAKVPSRYLADELQAIEQKLARVRQVQAQLVQEAA